MIKTSILYYKYRGCNKASIMQREKSCCCPQTRVTSYMDFFDLTCKRVAYIYIYAALHENYFTCTIPEDIYSLCSVTYYGLI